jgi:hypothetical protein
MTDDKIAVAKLAATDPYAESVEDWIVREARAISGPRTHLQDSEAVIQFGMRVAQYVLAKQIRLAESFGHGLHELVERLKTLDERINKP